MANFSRILAALVGLGIIGCVVHAAVMASGGYGSAAAPLMIGLGAGLAIGSVVVGRAYHEGRLTMARCLIAALVAGEVWSVLLTAERTIAHRDQQQVPLRAAAEARAKAAEHVKLTEVALTAIEGTPRLAEAREAKAAADAAVVSKSAEIGCRKHCKDLLQAQADAATAELGAARAEIESSRAAAETRLNTARAELNALPVPPSATPLADRLGIQGWQLDLAAAGLASLAANGLAACLLAFAAHGRPVPRRRIVDVASRPSPNTVIDHVRDPAEEADRFARTTFRPNPSNGLKLEAIRAAYHGWCRDRGLSPLPDQQIGAALNGLFCKVGLYRRGTGADAAIVGIDWNQPEPLRLEGSS